MKYDVKSKLMNKPAFSVNILTIIFEYQDVPLIY